MTADLRPVEPGEAGLPLWEVGRVRNLSRPALRAHLGDPFYVERDGACTFGGEEDWWAYRDASDEVVAICLRVPYGEAVLCVSHPSGSSIDRAAAALLGPCPLERFEEPRSL